MKKYLLLRNNKQTGPYSCDELLEMGLKSQDLLWAEGKSASWRYPAEFDEFKTLPSILQEVGIPDRLFTDVQNLVFHFVPEENIPIHSFPDDELNEFPTMARLLNPEIDSNPEPTREKITSTGILPVQSGIPEEVPEIKSLFEDQLADVDEKSASVEMADTTDTIDLIESTPIIGADDIIEPGFTTEPEVISETAIITTPEIEIPAIVPKRVSVTLPAAVSDKTFVVIHPKVNDKIAVPTRDIKPEPIPLATLHIPIEKVTESPVVYLPAAQNTSGNLLQKLAVAAGIISIIAVAGLIANSIFNPNAYNYQVEKKSIVTQPISLPPITNTQETLAESGNETAVPSNTNLQTPVSTNSTLTEDAVKQPKAKSKQEKANDNVAVPANSGNEEYKVNANVTTVSTEVKAPTVDPKEETRKNINKLVNYELNNYKVNAFGGVSDFEVVINNNSAYPLDLVVVELKYIQSNKKIFKTEKLEFKGIAPKGKQSIGVAKTNRGIKVETTITSISSRELDLGYHQ